MWMPFHPEAYKTGRVEYLEKELNELMAKKKENDETSKEQFKQRVQEAKKKAIQENIEKASKEGNKLMQSIDEDGNLINADRMDVPGKNLLFGDSTNDDICTADLRKELFNDDNVILDKKNDHGIGEILERQKKLNKEDVYIVVRSCHTDYEKPVKFEEEVEIVSERTLEELFTFVWNGQKAEAMQGYNDDLVMSLCIALWVRDTALRFRSENIETQKSLFDYIFSSIF